MSTAEKTSSPGMEPALKVLAEVPEAAKKDMKFVFVETVDDMLPVVFDGATSAASKARARTKGKKK